MANKSAVDTMIGAVAKATLLPFYARRLAAFMRSLDGARALQQTRMLTRIRAADATGFGRDHGFAAMASLRDYRHAVPIHTAGMIAPYLARVRAGETAALLPPSERVLALACSTGTTGAPKILPLTTSWVSTYRRSWEIWGAKAVVDHVDIIGTAWLQISGPANLLTSETGKPVGMLSAATARFQSPILKSFYVTPIETGDIVNARDRNYTILRLALPSRVGIIMTITPANLIRLAEIGNEHREALIRDIHDGTLRRDLDLDSGYRARIDRSIRARHPARARELEKIVERTGTLYPKDYWPLRLICCWTGGTVGHQTTRLATYYGDTIAVRDLGLISTEGRHTIPLEDHSPDGVLDPHGAYYEFAMEGETGPDRRTLEAHELEVGCTYSPIVSTSNGLYRFDLGDVVRCKGYIGEAPILEFLHKTEQYSDMEGEKVSAHDIVQAVAHAYRQLDLPVDQFTVLPVRGDGRQPHYGILLEASEHCIRTEDEARRFLGLVDDGLGIMNFGYRMKRNDLSIGAPRLMVLADGSWSRCSDIAGRKWGTGDTQHKHPVLLRTDAWPDGTVLAHEIRMAAH